jgi:hypothetical protein
MALGPVPLRRLGLLIGIDIRVLVAAHGMGVFGRRGRRRRVGSDLARPRNTIFSCLRAKSSLASQSEPSLPRPQRAMRGSGCPWIASMLLFARLTRKSRSHSTRERGESAGLAWRESAITASTAAILPSASPAAVSSDAPSTVAPQYCATPSLIRVKISVGCIRSPRRRCGACARPSPFCKAHRSLPWPRSGCRLARAEQHI